MATQGPVKGCLSSMLRERARARLLSCNRDRKRTRSEKPCPFRHFADIFAMPTMLRYTRMPNCCALMQGEQCGKIRDHSANDYLQHVSLKIPYAEELLVEQQPVRFRDRPLTPHQQR